MMKLFEEGPDHLFARVTTAIMQLDMESGPNGYTPAHVVAACWDLLDERQRQFAKGLAEAQSRAENRHPLYNEDYLRVMQIAKHYEFPN